MRLMHSLAVALLATACAAPLAQAELRLPRTSQKQVVSQTIGITDMTVTYHRPGVKGRTIWGELVPFGEPWRTGANEATQFETSTDILVEGKALPAGTYSLVTIPNKDKWTVVFSKQKELWGAFGYKPEEDQLRIQVTPATAPAMEWMAITLDPTGPAAAELAIHWEKLRVAVPLSVDVNGMVLKASREAIAAAKPDDWRTPMGAAAWCMDAGIAMDEAAQWAAAAVKAEENPRTLAVSARIAQKTGKSKDAVTHMTKAVTLAKADAKFSKDLLATYEKDLQSWTGK